MRKGLLTVAALILLAMPPGQAVADKRRVPATKTIVVKGIRDPVARVAGLETGELDLAFGLTGKLLPRVMKNKDLRWVPNFRSSRSTTTP